MTKFFRCKAKFLDCNWERYYVTSPKTGQTLCVNQGWAGGEEVFNKIKRAEKDSGAGYNEEFLVALTLDDLRAFKAAHDREVAATKGRKL